MDEPEQTSMASIVHDLACEMSMHVVQLDEPLRTEVVRDVLVNLMDACEQTPLGDALAQLWKDLA